ncbi:histidine phosphatase superfamily [Diplogelasinospora grovesii]|uniref:Histidine phosphatase superfamily n=1 Tax=Diplogelasinospora grovesii TaxID=303347 RepID=A0AAN6SA90_9PEZI|nr:histidine phosphatase superfamily [Diplogelasinospora grovesii]
MAALSVALSLAALVGAGSAQSTSEHIWSSVAWIYYGERTPLYGPNPATLTSIGAQQMYRQGQMFRTRYLENSNLTEGENAVTTHAPIVGIEPNAIDNTQLNIMTSTDEYTGASALAFMQGLYPPLTQAFANNTGGMDAAMLANGSIVNYPLGGYQYPQIRTTSVLDPESVWIEGNAYCTKYTQSLIDLRTDGDVVSTYQDTLPFYHALWDRIFQKQFRMTMANFYNAYLLYDYASFQYNHDNETRALITADNLTTLAQLASSEQRYRNANLSASDVTGGNMIRTIAGRTMAAKVVALFRDNINSAGASGKMNLVFSSFEPFVAFFALASLINGPSGANFVSLPNPGAAMVFELFSIGGNESAYPSVDNLWVRFYYRNGTDSAAPFIQYSLFGNGNANSRLQFTDFVTEINSISVDSVASWCQVCDSVGAALFCSGLLSNSAGAGDPSAVSGGGNPVVNPVIAGVIGAAVSISVIGLAILAAIVYGGVRFHRAGSPQARNSTLGGFKGAEKMASDTDIAYAKSGVRHERTGSWELHDGGNGKGVMPTVPVQAHTTAGAAVKARDFASSSTKPIDDDAVSVMSEMGQVPVKPREF